LSGLCRNCNAFRVGRADALRYPPQYADSAWDNTGLLIEAPWQRSPNLQDAALLTIDLTREVATEAINKRVSVIMAYRKLLGGGEADLLDPIIFSGLKSITLQNSQQESILRLIQAGISVYSPHTAVDATPGGMCDWLVEVALGRFARPRYVESCCISNIAGLNKLKFLKYHIKSQQSNQYLLWLVRLHIDT